MSVYAPTTGFVDQRRHPRALLMIVGVHVAAIAAVMTAKMDLPGRIIDRPIKIDWIDPITSPPENPPPPEPIQRPQPPTSTTYVPPTEVPIPIPKGPEMDATQIPIPPSNDSVIGPNLGPFTPVVPAVVRTGPRFVTPDWLVKPPYPADKQRLEEEATLKLRLAIDERGRVISVEPIGRADPSFLATAQRHLIAKWRYQPATEGGRPVSSSIVITLRFELE